MSDPIDVEKDLFSHIAAAHLRTGNMLRMVKRTVPAVLIYAKATDEDLKYGVFKEGMIEPEITYETARDAVQHFLDVHKRHRVPLGDIMFGNPSGLLAVTWRHLRVRLPTLRWVLQDDESIVAGILEEAATT